MTLQKDPEGTETIFLKQGTVFTNRRVLEIGCGDGRLTWRYARSVGSVVAFDLDIETLKEAAAGRPIDLYKSVSLLQASSINLPFPNATFDIALLAWSF